MDVKTELKNNMLRYVVLKSQIDKLKEEQDMLKSQNLAFVKTLGLKKGEYAIFDEISLQIQLIEMVKKESVDEEGLVKKYGREKTDYLKVIPVKAVELAIKIGKLPKDADDFFVKADPVEYTKITKV